MNALEDWTKNTGCNWNVPVILPRYWIISVISPRKDGKPNGHGSFWFKDGGKFVGDWKNGQANGEGLQTYAEGPKGNKEFPFDTASRL